MVATQIFFMFTPIFGKDSHFDEHIFHMGWFNHELDKPLWASLLSNQFSRLKCSLGIVTQNSWGCFLVGFVYQVQHDTSHENQKNEAALPWNNMPVLKYWSISRLQNVIYRHRSNGVIDLESRPFTFNITSELVKGKKETSTNPLPLIAKGMGLLIYLLFLFCIIVVESIQELQKRARWCLFTFYNP